MISNISFQSRLNFPCVFWVFWWVRWFTPSCTLPGRLVITSCPDFHGKVPKQATSALLWAVPASGEVPFGWSTGAIAAATTTTTATTTTITTTTTTITTTTTTTTTTTGASQANNYEFDPDLHRCILRVAQAVWITMFTTVTLTWVGFCMVLPYCWSKIVMKCSASYSLSTYRCRTMDSCVFCFQE